MVPRATEAPGVIGQFLLNNPSGRRLTLSQVLSVVYEWVERRWSGMLTRVRRRGG
jgi:hypothetical protein